MASVLGGNNVEEEFPWACTLDKDTKEVSWDPSEPSDSADDNEEDPNVKPGHRLLIKLAILPPTAKQDEVSIVQLDCQGYKQQKVSVPFVAMKGGTDLQRYVDLLVPCNSTIKLVQGEGPIHLVGSHCVDFYGYRDLGGGMEDAESSEDDEMDMEEQETAEDVKKQHDGKEEKAVNGKKEPGSAEKKRDPGSAEKKREPGSAEKKQNGSAEKKREPGSAEKPKNGSAEKKRKASSDTEEKEGKKKRSLSGDKK